MRPGAARPSALLAFLLASCSCVSEPLGRQAAVAIAGGLWTSASAPATRGDPARAPGRPSSRAPGHTQCAAGCGLARLRGGRYRAELDSIGGARAQRKKTRKTKRKLAAGGPAPSTAGGQPFPGDSTSATSAVTALKEVLRSKLHKTPAPAPAGLDETAPTSELEQADAGGVPRKKHRPGSFQALGLDNSLLRGMYHAGYKFPTPVQRKVIPHVLSGNHVVAMARTGSGKTAAFLAPMIQRLVTLTAKARSTGRVLGVKGLVLLPTRELALQAFTFFKTYAKFTPISACLMAGGESIDAQFSALAANPEVVIATPGRLLQILNEVPAFHLRGVRVVVLDEADRLFESALANVVLEVLAACQERRDGVRIIKPRHAAPNGPLPTGPHAPDDALGDADPQEGADEEQEEGGAGSQTTTGQEPAKPRRAKFRQMVRQYRLHARVLLSRSLARARSLLSLYSPQRRHTHAPK